MEARMAMMAMTTRSSISVKAFREQAFAFMCLWYYLHGRNGQAECLSNTNFNKRGKSWVDRDPPVVKLKVLSTRRKDELLLLLRRSRSNGAQNLPSSRRAQHLL
jgi:hypothetical protein